MGETVNQQETFVEVLTAALLLIVLALFLFGNVNEPLAMLAGGVILLGSGVYQTSRGWHVSLITWITGIVLTLGGIGVRLFLVSVLQINWVAVALVIIAGWLILTTLGRR